ncbi:hypothetical protein G9A89_016975 [Geosiphon pyriformis]|nr:hypothetical protein G9A89_016975 [Geosiphon pyriformis]
MVLQVVLGNIKHSGDKKDISLIKSGLGSVDLDLNNESSNDKNVNISGIGVINNAVFGSLLSFSNFGIDNDEKVSLPFHLSISLDKKKIFATINGFGGATTLSKFERIIRSMFTSKESMEKATSLAREKEITINSNLKKQRIHSD